MIERYITVFDRSIWTALRCAVKMILKLGHGWLIVNNLQIILGISHFSEIFQDNMKVTLEIITFKTFVSLCHDLRRKFFLFLIVGWN